MARFFEIHDGRRCKRRGPSLNVFSVGIELFSLELGVENAEIRCCVITATGDPLPVEGIGGGIGIHKSVPEPFLAVAPINPKVLC